MELPEYLSSGELARLMPVVADTSKEVRAASILLATLMNVQPFARVVIGSLGQRIGTRTRIHGFTEVVFQDSGATTKARPDGLLVVDGSGGRQWRCIIEAKIGRAELDSEQIERYLSIAKSNKIDAVLTISNQFVALPTHSPVKVSKISTRGVDLFHWSWMSVVTEAMLLVNGDDFERSEQKYILAEMVRYFDHPSVGVSSFDQMNSDWKELNAQVQAGAKISRGAAAVENTVAAWHQESRDLCLLMSRELSRLVRLKISRTGAGDPSQRLRDDCISLAETHELNCVLEVPDAAAPIDVVADLKRRSISVGMKIIAPRDKQKTASRVNWLLRQLAKVSSDGVFVRATWPGRAPPTQKTLEELRSNSTILQAENTSLVPSQFEIVLVRDLAGKFSGSRKFVEELEVTVPEFYERVGQHLRAYVAPPPRLRTKGEGDQIEETIAKNAEDAAAEATEITQANN